MGPEVPYSVTANDHEIVTLAFTLAAAGFTVWKSRAIRLLPSGRILLVPAVMIAVSWAATVLEGFILPDFFNAVEHLSMLGAGISLGAWVIAARRREAVP